jgi:hypothetical protein
MLSGSMAIAALPLPFTTVDVRESVTMAKRSPPIPHI